MAKRTFLTDVRRDLAVVGIAFLAVLVLSPRPTSAGLARDLFQAAKAAESGRPEVALEALERALAFDPALASLHGAAAQLALDAGALDAAAEHVAAARQFGSGQVQLHCLEAALLLARAPLGADIPAPAAGCQATDSTIQRWSEVALLRGDLAGVEDVLQAWVADHPDDVGAWEERVGLRLAVEPGSARPLLLQALRHHPAGSALLDELVTLLPDEEPAPPSPEVSARVGELFAAQGRWAIAEAAWSAALELEPDFPQALAYLGLAETRLGRDGLPMIRQAADRAPEDPIVLGLLGQILLEQAEVDEALLRLQEARRLDPTNPAFAAALGRALAVSGDYQAASLAFLDAANLAPDTPAFWLLLSSFSLQNDFEVEALGRLAARNAVALEGRESSALGALGYAWHVAGDSTLADRLLRRSLASHPDDAATWYRFALVSTDLGRTGEARASLRAVLALDPGGTLGLLAERTLQGIPGGG